MNSATHFLLHSLTPCFFHCEFISSLNSLHTWIQWMFVALLFLQPFYYCSGTGTNLNKQELFVMAIRAPTGRTFPGNFTIILSSKKWVFHAIFRHAFLSLYGEFICSLNRFVLTNEEDAEYLSFECSIETHNVFQFSRVILCAFHAVW